MSESSPSMQSVAGRAPALEHGAPPRPAERALRAARDYLRAIQDDDGHWCAELEGDSILESEYILTLWFLGRGGEPRVAKAAEYLRRKQLQSGGWAVYEGGPAEVSASVKAYFVLKLLGDDPDAPHMARARDVIIGLGGIEACNSFTKIYLAIFGQFPWRRCPAVPPEMILLPRWCTFNIYEMSSWSRAIVVPLSIIWAHQPRVEVPEFAQISELRGQRREPINGVVRLLGRRTFWTVFFTVVDRWIKIRERMPWKPLRPRALKRTEAWIHERLEKSDGLGAIFPPIINTIIAFRCLGYAVNDPRVQRQVAELEKLEIEEDDTLRVQPCFSPVWDTALALNALLESGVAENSEEVTRATRWLVDHEVRSPGDWCERVPGVEPGGWYFEYANEFYPDCDDTSEVLIALARLGSDVRPRVKDAVRRGADWMLAMQNDDGGWAAFDKGCDREVFSYVPFADHNAMLDPSCEDITGRTLEAFHALGIPRDHPAVLKACAWLWSRQEPDGTWYGRWGCNYIYGTWLAVSGLCASGHRSDPRLAKAADWLLGVQNEDGGWGESPLSYDEPATKGQGESTAAQTAWAILALHAVGHAEDEAVDRGIAWLLERQRADGSWQDVPWTGTGFPRVFYLRYHLYATYFPLLALAAHTRTRTTLEAPAA